MGKVLAAAAVVAVVFGVSGLARAETSIGDLVRVHETVYGTPPSGQQSAKHQGDGVVFQESLETWAGSEALLRFIDGSNLAMGPKAKVLIDEFVFDPSKTDGNALIKISAGTLRWVTGAMPKGQTVIKTPTATLTLRGTDVTVTVHPDGTTDTTVREGLVDAHNNVTNSDTTLGPGDSQTSDQDGNHSNGGSELADLGGNPTGNDGNTPEHRRSDEAHTPQPERHQSEAARQPEPCDCQ